MKRYTLSQLEAFAAIVDCGTFRLASEKLGITQPTISLRIQELEAVFGCRLFLRGKGGVRLTEPGQVMLQYVRHSLESLDEMALRLRTNDPLSGVLRLGASNTFALSCLPAILSELELTQPRLNVELTISNSMTLSSMLGAHNLDVALLADTPVAPHVKVEPLALSELAWFVGPGIPIGPRAIRPQDLGGFRIMTMPAPALFHTILSEWFAQAKVPLPTLSTCNDMATVLRLVRHGVAISLLPTSIANVELQAGTIRRCRASPPLPPVTLCVACQSSMRGPGRDAIVRIVRDVLARPDVPLTAIRAAASPVAGQASA